MINEHQLIAIFCEIDDFCKELDKNISHSIWVRGLRRWFPRQKPRGMTGVEVAQKLDDAEERS